MINYFIYAKDYSQSTYGVDFYHKNGLLTLEEFKRDVEKIQKKQLRDGEFAGESVIVYLHWGHECFTVTEEETREAYWDRQCGWMCTSPDCIITHLKNNVLVDKEYKIKLLYIVTDGMIDTSSIENCFELNKDMHYEMVVFHAFNEDLREIDLSVATSFFKSLCLVYRNNELYDNTDISKDFDYDKINVENFATEREELISYIKLKFITQFQQNLNALQEIDKLKKLRDRLFDEWSKKAGVSETNICLDTKDRNVFLQNFYRTIWYTNLVAASYSDKVGIEKTISTLINYIVSDTKSYSFDALKFDKKFDTNVVEEEIIDVDFTPEQEIEFPDVILDDDKGIPVVILMEFNLMDKIIFHGQHQSTELPPASFSKFKSIMDCPLFLANDQDISKSIGYFYTLNVYKQLLANNTKTEPRTRRPFKGGLVLTDTNQFDKYNDYILSATYFDCKKVKYNIGLFYFVLWKNCENKEWMDKNVLEQFKKYTMRRISETKCKIGLSSLPLDPQERTTLLTALWYCVELSSCIFKNDPENFNQERLRGHHSVAHYMIEILKYFNYDLDLETIEKRRELISEVMALKRIHQYREKVYYFLEKIFKNVDGFLISEIEKASNLYKLNYLKLYHKGMLRDDIIKEKVYLNDYVHLMHYVGDLDASKAGKSTYDICEKTFRPFFAIDLDKSFYTELVKITKKVVINNDDDKDKIGISYENIDTLEFHSILSLYKLFIDCVKKLEKYPTLPEYFEYILYRKMFYGDLVTIFPSSFYYDIKNVYERYQKIINKVEVSEFIKVCKSHVTRSDRIKAEEKVVFRSDSEISEFISQEEFKVKLKKKEISTK